MKQFDENRYKEALSLAPWDTVLVFDEVDDMLDSWESLFSTAYLMKIAPVKARCPSSLDE